MRVLVTGFEPFGGEVINPTNLLVEHVNSCSLKVPAGLDVRGLRLPVVFDSAFKRLDEELKVFQPDWVLAFGQAGGRDAIEFERVAINCLDADIPDNQGWQPRDLKIQEDGQEAFFSTLPIRLLEEGLDAAGVRSRISNSAGTYVCNYLFYRLMERLQFSTVKAGFIHVPYLPEQAAAKNPVPPSMELSKMIQALETILSRISEIYSKSRDHS